MRQFSEIKISDKPHGDRNRYRLGCRCVPCRAAHSAYTSFRASLPAEKWNGYVPAEKARKHVFKLSKLGIGHKTIADITGISVSTLQQLKRGERKYLRSLNAKAILAVDRTALPDSALVSAAKTWERIEWLKNEGYTLGEIAIRIGNKSRNLNIGKELITAKTEMRIRKFYEAQL